MNQPVSQIGNAISQGITPVSSVNQNVKPSTNVADASIGVYAASMKTGLTTDEARIIENWSFVNKTHKKLMGMSNKDAEKEYNSLSEESKAWLDTYYNVDYAHKPEENSLIQNKTTRDILGLDDGFGIVDGLKSPFKALFALGAEYGKAINTFGNAIQMKMVGGQASLDQLHDGKALYNPEYVDPLIQKYGGARSFAAMKLLAGMTPGEVIDAWGPNDPQMIEAINEAFDPKSNFNSMLSEFEQAKISPGRTIAHKINEALNINEKDHPWLFKLGSGSIDFAYQIFADPMTYMTFGGSAIAKGMGKLGKGAELLSGEAASVAKYFSNAKNQKLWSDLSTQLGEYRTAADAGNLKQAAEIRTNIKNQFPEYANDTAIELFTTGETKIKDLASAQDFFTKAENTSKLIRLRVNGLDYAREGAMTMRRSRNFTNGARLKTREFFQGKTDFSALDEKDLNTFVDELTKIGQDMEGTADATKALEIIDKNAKAGIRGSIEKLAARFPGSKHIFTADEKYIDTLDLVREQAYVAIGDKRMAEAVAIKFANLGTQAERVAMRKALDEVTLRRMGLDKVSGGKQKMANILNAKYGFTLSDNVYAAGGELKVPARFKDGEMGTVKPVTGPLLPFQNTNAIGGLPWREVKEFMASRSLENVKDGGIEVLPKLVGGAFNNKYVNNITDVWTTFTLAPRLGIRTAIDEGFMFGMYMTTGLAKEFINAKRAGNILSAYLGTAATTGPVKNLIQGALSNRLGRGVGSARAIPMEIRNKIRTKYEDDFRAGRIEEWELEKAYKNEIFDMALERFGKRLPDTHKQWLKEAALSNPRMIDEVSSRQLGSVLTGRAGLVTSEKSLLDESQLTQAMSKFGYLPGDTFNVHAAQALQDDQLLLAMYRNFYTAFATRPYKFTDGSFASPASMFMKHNGLKDSTDYANFQREFMENIGFNKEGEGWIVGNQKKVDEFLNQSRQTMKEGMTQHQVALNFIEDTASELSYRLHGSVDGYNDKIVEHMNRLAKDDGTPMPAYMAAEKMSFDEYSELMKDHKSTDMVRTDIDFGLQTRNLGAWASRYGQDKIFEAMARTTDDLFRQPVVHAHYFMYRKQYENLEKQYANQLFDNMPVVNDRGNPIPEEVRRRRADEAANRYFVEQSLEDAVHHTLKYSDNPDVRSMFAENMRTVGRFYRAVEDFQRRMYRLYKDRGLQAVYKARMMNQGLSAVGQIHRDDNGQAYIVMPMDDQIFHAVDTTLRTLSRGRMGVNQPLFNDITFKLSAGNPSFQDDAGVPYLSGPMGSLSVMGMKAIMGKFSPLKSQAEDIDNALLGNIGDNMTLRKAVMPRGLETVWKLLSYDEKSQQEVSATMQAIAYNQANGYGVYPDDPKYKLADGTIDEAAFQRDLAEYQSDVQITAHNVLWLRNMLGLISPIAPVLQESKDLPEYIKHNGVTSMRSSFFDVLDNVDKMYPGADDPYELALAVWTGENRGRLAYMPSRNDAEVNVAMNYSRQMQDWMLEHDSLVKQYGNAAILFAPKVGEFSPGVYNWAKGAGFINNRPVGDYLNEVVMQDSVNAYYDLTDEETSALVGKILPDERRTVLDRYAEKKKQMLLTTPYLEEKIGNFANNEAKAKFLNDVYSIVNDTNVNIDPNVRSTVTRAFQVYNNFMASVNSIEVRQASNSTEIKRTLKQNALQELTTLSNMDDTKTVEQLVRISFKGLMNAKSRDAQNTIG
jgi:hypothetical protein